MVFEIILLLTCSARTATDSHRIVRLHAPRLFWVGSESRSLPQHQESRAAGPVRCGVCTHQLKPPKAALPKWIFFWKKLLLLKSWIIFWSLIEELFLWTTTPGWVGFDSCETLASDFGSKWSPKSKFRFCFHNSHRRKFAWCSSDGHVVVYVLAWQLLWFLSGGLNP